MPLTKNIEEIEIANLIRARSRDGFDMLYERYSSLLYGIITRTITDTSVSEMLLQEVFVKIWKTIDQYDAERCGLYTWMIQIVASTCTTYKKSQDTTQNSTARSLVDMGASKGIDIEAQISLAHPEDAHREILDLLILGGYSYQEIVKTFGISLETLKKMVRTALMVHRRKT